MRELRGCQAEIQDLPVSVNDHCKRFALVDKINDIIVSFLIGHSVKFFAVYGGYYIPDFQACRFCGRVAEHAINGHAVFKRRGCVIKELQPDTAEIALKFVYYFFIVFFRIVCGVFIVGQTEHIPVIKSLFCFFLIKFVYRISVNDGFHLGKFLFNGSVGGVRTCIYFKRSEATRYRKKNNCGKNARRKCGNDTFFHLTNLSKQYQTLSAVFSADRLCFSAVFSEF